MQDALALNARIASSTVGIRWLKIAVIYFVVGVTLGIFMGATEDFTLKPVHAHMNLLGWATLALAGVIYTLFPRAGESRLGKLHFWLQNISLPVMMVSLAVVLHGNTAVVPLLVAAEFAAFVGVILFAVNVFINVKHA